MDCFMQDVKETLTFIPGPWCLTAVLWLACFWTFLKHTQKNVLVQWKKLHLAKRQPSGQEWEQSTEQTRSSAAFTERTGADLLEHTSIRGVQVTCTASWIYVTAPLHRKQIGHRWEVGYNSSSRRWDLASSLSHKTPFFRKWHLNVIRATSKWLSDTFCNLDSGLFALFKCWRTDFLAEDARSTSDWTINLPADMASNFKYQQQMSLEITQRSYSPELDCLQGKHFPHNTRAGVSKLRFDSHKRTLFIVNWLRCLNFSGRVSQYFVFGGTKRFYSRTSSCLQIFSPFLFFFFFFNFSLSVLYKKYHWRHGGVKVLKAGRVEAHEARSGWCPHRRDEPQWVPAVYTETLMNSMFDVPKLMPTLC